MPNSECRNAGIGQDLQISVSLRGSGATVAIRKFLQSVALRRPVGGKGNGLPRQCAHWLAMTTIFEGAVGEMQNAKCKMQNSKCKMYRIREF